MKLLLRLACASAALTAISASGASIIYNNGVTNTSNASGPAWVAGSNMFLNIIDDYGGSPLGPSGGSGASQNGFDLFDPGGGGLDITLLSWTLGSMTLYEGPGTATLSPGPATPGFEDYRYDDNGGLAPTNLTFFYNGAEWASGYVTRFVTEVANSADIDATGAGDAIITTNTPAGLAFFNEVMTLSSGTGQLSFVADSFTPVAPSDPGTFGSTGSITVVPEPSTMAALFGASALGITFIRRRRKS
ncbi:PEP-CTERM sorting domain-containing protein [Rubellicoccus peritrichatus]|uniref:PEP-CTERM sorting domain-containing protein n=1 Tax=Rubellicoccus peritrichatus TaxID=3080537 RepID=A0AAQ3QRC3_9BACT|nr:PEP-CTERM sorting domain-containing protein [Puniceicoccus sp. CR14]WOO41183.1 PEP-CTERM sorting domain-containing protein [Puniceicoccus sp. CR14]